MKKIFFPFTTRHTQLQTKWWHRFFVVTYVISLLFFFLPALAVTADSLPESLFNLEITDNLRDFSKNSSISIANTVPSFLNLKGKFGCLRNSKINYLSTYSLESNAVCSSDISIHIDETANKLKDMMDDESIKTEVAKKFVLDDLSKNIEKRFCFIDKNIDCASDEIVNYHFNIFYYLQIVVYSVLATYLFSIFLQIIYFKGFIYIIYGKNKN